MKFFLLPQAAGSSGERLDRRSAGSTVAAALNRLSFAITVLCIAWLPIPWGSNRVWSWTMMELTVFLCLALVCLSHFSASQAGAPGLRGATAAIALLCTWLVYQLVQSVPLSSGLVTVLSPHAWDLYSAVTPLLSEQAAAALSIDRGTTLSEFLKYAAYVSLFVLVATLAVSKWRLKLLAWTLVAVGTSESVFGIYSARTGLRLFPDSWLDGHFDLVVGTFVNRNHFAAHLAMATAVAGGLLLANWQHTYTTTWRGRLSRALDFLVSERGVIFWCMVIMLGGLVLSASRAGVLALLAAFAMVTGLATLARGRKGAEWTLLLPLLGAVGVALLWMGAGSLPVRLMASGAEFAERYAQWVLTTDMIRDFWLFGIGAGNYAWLFAGYQDASLDASVIYDHAHSDYLELLAEQGLIGTLLLGTAVLVLLGRIVNAFQVRHDRFLRGILFGSLVGMLAMLIHAVVDFNFRIPANAAWFFVLAGMGTAAAKLGHDS